MAESGTADVEMYRSGRKNSFWDRGVTGSLGTAAWLVAVARRPIAAARQPRRRTATPVMGMGGSLVPGREKGWKTLPRRAPAVNQIVAGKDGARAGAVPAGTG